MRKIIGFFYLLKRVAAVPYATENMHEFICIMWEKYAAALNTEML